MMRLFSGIVTLARSVADGAVTLQGPRALTRELGRWFLWSPFVPAVRERLALGVAG